LRTQTRGQGEKSTQSYLDQVIGWASVRRHTALHGLIEATRAPNPIQRQRSYGHPEQGGQPMLPGNWAALWC